MAIVGNKTSKQVFTNEDKKPLNMDNNIVIDGYANNEIERYSKYIDGPKLTLDYYSYHRGSNSENPLLDIGDDTQQYIKIKQLELTVLTAISPNNYQDVSLDVVIDVGLVPAENDVAVFRLFNGQLGMFRVSDIVRRNYIARKIYECRLTFLYYENANREYFTDLYSKIVKNYVYDKNYVSTNSAPIILEPTYRNKVNLITNYNGLIQSYLKMFLNNRVISYKDDEVSFFDSSIQKLVMSLITEDQFKLIKLVEELNEVETIVDLLITKEDSINPRYDYYNLRDIKFDLQIDKAMSIASALVDNEIEMSLTAGTSFPDMGLAGSEIIPNNYRNGSNLYLFSNQFYSDDHTGVDELSVLEKLVLSYLDNETINTKQLDSVIEDMNNWTRLEIYYYVPVLLLLMRYTTLNTYDRI